MPSFAGFLDLGFVGAAALGCLTALHPCPLSALVAAVAVVFEPGRGLGRNLSRGLWLASGMIVAFVLLTVAAGHGLLRLAVVSGVLPTYVRPFLAPLLIAVGMLQLGHFSRAWNRGLAGRVERTLGDRRGSWLALFLLGMVQAAAFCPATAGLFLGVLLPFAIAQEAPGLVALGFGVGYGLPLLAVTAGLEMGVRLESFRGKAESLTYWSGWVLIALGAWETWQLV